MSADADTKTIGYLRYRWERWSGGYRFGLYEPVFGGSTQKICEWSMPYAHADSCVSAMDAHADGWRQCYRAVRAQIDLTGFVP
jgi:hypothetical protein